MTVSGPVLTADTRCMLKSRPAAALPKREGTLTTRTGLSRFAKAAVQV